MNRREVKINKIDNIYQLFNEEIIDVIIKPRPSPAIMQPTNINTDLGRKKNPTPKPKSNPPPIAHVLLSSFTLVLIL